MALALKSCWPLGRITAGSAGRLRKDTTLSGNIDTSGKGRKGKTLLLPHMRYSRVKMFFSSISHLEGQSAERLL